MPWVPKKPDRSGPHVAHHNWMHERVTGSPDNPMLIAGSGIVLSVNEHGQTTIRSTAVGGGGSSTMDVKAYKIEVDGDAADGLYCKRFTGSGVVGEVVQILKPKYLQLASKPSDSHVTYPPYFDGDIIYACNADGGLDAGVPVGFDLNVDARRWALDLEVCIDDVPYHGLFVCGALTAV